MGTAVAVNSGSSTAAARIAEVAFVALCPAVAFWVMHFPPIAQNGFIDPFIYTGYINNFEDLVQRYGATYYSVRFGLLAPAELSAAVLGPVGGYFTLRYAFALLAAVPFYVLVRQQFGRAAAVSVLSLLLTSPYFARTLLWDHPDASGVPMLFAAVCLWLIEGRRRWLFESWAAICAGLAVHSNVFVAAPLAVFVASWTVLSLLWRRGVRATSIPLVILVSGIGVITALGSAYYRWRVGVTDMFSVTINQSVQLASGGMAEWRTPGVEWMRGNWHVLTPVALALLALLVCSRRRIAFQQAVMWTCAAGVTAFFYVAQFGLNGNSLELFYYFSYLLPFVFLLLALIVGTLLNGVRDQRMKWIASALTVSTAIGPWILHSFGRGGVYPTRLVHHLVAAGASASALILWRAAPRYRPVTLLVAAAALGLMFFSSFSTPVYRSMIDSRVRMTRSELDVYRVAQQLIESVPRTSSTPGAVGFWYSDKPADSSIRSVQSTYLRGYSKIQADSRGLPYLEPADLDRLGRMKLRWLVLLAERNADLALGRETLRQLDIQHTLVDSRPLSAGTYTIYFELLELGGGGER